MYLCVDVGNTTIRFGFYKDETLQTKLVLNTDLNKSSDEYYYALDFLCRQRGVKEFDVKDIIYSSVVPNINNAFIEALKKLFADAKVFILDNNAPHLLRMDIDNPKEVGSDLIADLVGAKKKYSAPLIVIDLGTATKLLLLDKNEAFKSALIMPGVEVASRSLFDKAALLPEVDLSNPTSLLDSKNTSECIKHGIIFGHLESIIGLCARYEKELGYKVNKIVTGGNALYFANLFPIDYIYDDALALDGELDILNRMRLRGK